MLKNVISKANILSIVIRNLSFDYDNNRETKNPTKSIQINRKETIQEIKEICSFYQSSFRVCTNKQYGIVTTFVEPKLLTNKST